MRRLLLSEGGSREMNSELDSIRSKGGRGRRRLSPAAGPGVRAAPLRRTTMAVRRRDRAGPAPASAATARADPPSPPGSLRLAAFLPSFRLPRGPRQLPRRRAADPRGGRRDTLRHALPAAAFPSGA